MLFRFTLDGTILSDEPEGWDDIVSELKRDRQIRGQVLLMDLTLKFKGGTDGYAHLKPLIDCMGYCAYSTLNIEESCNNDNTWVTIFEGFLFFTEIKEHLFPCILECQLTDNSFFAQVDNNKNIEAYVNVGRSKNDVAITAAQGYDVFFFDVVTGLNIQLVTVYPVWSCFQFIIDYMTDGEMGFVSDYFYGNLVSGDGRYMTITTGEQIRLGKGGSPTIFPFISFQKLFEEVNKKVRIAFSIETIAGVKTMRIEPESYFYNTGAVSTTLNNVKGIIKSVNTAELYSRLKIGSSDTIEYVLGQTDFPNAITMLGFKEESYTLTGKCNIDNTLDLVSDWIIDSNVIQSVLAGDTGYDENIFFVMVDYISVPQVAIQTDVFNTTLPVFYNDFLRNANVAQRWVGGIPNSIAIYQGSTNDEFIASSTSDVAAFMGTIEPFAFQDDFTTPNADPNNRYNNINYRYTAPSAGVYTFETVMLLDILNITFCNPSDPNFVYFIDFTLVKYDAANVEIETIVDFRRINSLGLNTITSSYTTFLNATDYVVIRLFTSASNICSPFTMFWKTGSTFACTATVTGGGQFAAYNPEDFKAYLYEIKDYPLTFSQYQAIIANPLDEVGFNDGADISGSGWIENKKYNHRKGTADFILSKSLPKTTCE